MLYLLDFGWRIIVTTIQHSFRVFFRFWIGAKRKLLNTYKEYVVFNLVRDFHPYDKVHKNPRKGKKEEKFSFRFCLRTRFIVLSKLFFILIFRTRNAVSRRN